VLGAAPRDGGRELPGHVDGGRGAHGRGAAGIGRWDVIERIA
jgi:hypothetical protein